MKRFHVHVAVTDLEANIHFYQQLFSQAPIEQKLDYASWQLDQPALDFSISSKGSSVGIERLGFHLNTEQQLQTRQGLPQTIAIDNASEPSDKDSYTCGVGHVLSDPQGIVWQVFVSKAQPQAALTENDADELACCSLSEKPSVECCDSIESDEMAACRSLLARVFSHCCTDDNVDSQSIASCCTLSGTLFSKCCGSEKMNSETLTSCCSTLEKSLTQCCGDARN